EFIFVSFAGSDSLSRTENTIPAACKHMKIVTIRKSGTHGGCTKLRPIALTYPSLKLMQKLIIHVLQPSLKAIGDPNQFACRSRGSTLDVITLLYHNITYSADKNVEYVRCAILDYISVFDSIPTPLSLDKLHGTNTECWIISWLYLYFSDRKLHTVLTGKRSTSLLTVCDCSSPNSCPLPCLFSFPLHHLTSSPSINFTKYPDELTVPIPISSSTDSSQINHFLSTVRQ
ncbi:unnamed protein product, partial [Heterobilharzia americana]